MEYWVNQKYCRVDQKLRKPCKPEQLKNHKMDMSSDSITKANQLKRWNCLVVLKSLLMNYKLKN